VGSSYITLVLIAGLRERNQLMIWLVIWGAKNLQKLEDFQNTLCSNPPFREKYGMWPHFSEANNGVHSLATLKWSRLLCPRIPHSQLRSKIEQVSDTEATHKTHNSLWMRTFCVMRADFLSTRSWIADFSTSIKLHPRLVTEINHIEKVYFIFLRKRRKEPNVLQPLCCIRTFQYLDSPNALRT
jgi:hypothetical protein